MRTTTARRTRPARLSSRGIGSLPLSYYVVIAICGCIIAAGFLFAARQHFVSMDLGMKNSKLRKQLEDLESESRRLTLAREIALSPMEMTRTARGLGFVAAGETVMQPVITAGTTVQQNKAGEVARAENRVKSEQVAQLTRTAFQRPAGAPIVSAELTAKARNDKTEQRGEGVRPQIRRPDVTAVAKLR
jgi:hypothetical protein